MRKNTRLVIATALLPNLLITASVAEEKRPWDVELDIGAIATAGNTETTSLQLKVDAKHSLEHWENQYIFSSLFKQDDVEQDDGSTDTEKTAEKYLGSVKTAYLLGVEKSYLFAFGSRTHDKFGAYRTYTTLALGYGDWLYSTPRLNWFLEAGPGYFEGEKVLEGQDELTPDTLVDETGGILRAATALEWKITKTAEFKQVISVESGEDNTRSVSETSLSASISDAMQMKIGVSIANDTEVAPGKEKTDTTTFVNVAYNF